MSKFVNAVATTVWLLCEISNGQLQSGEPFAKKLVAAMDEEIATHVDWNDYNSWSKIMGEYFDEDFIYDTVFGLGNFTGIEEFYNGEHIPWNMAYPNATFAGDIGFIFAGSQHYTVTCTGYAEAFMMGNFVTIPATNKQVTIIDLDFYIVSNVTNKISYNWCIMDTYGMMVQSGYRLLPYNGLPEGIFYPPMSMYGIPGPISKFVYLNDSTHSEMIVRAALDEDFVLQSNKLTYWNSEAKFYGGYGLGYAHNVSIYYNSILKPMFQDSLNETYIKYDLVVCEGKFCGAHFYLYGKQMSTLFGQNATIGSMIHIRFGMHFLIKNDLIDQAWCLLDIPDAVNQMGTNLWTVINETGAIKAAIN